MSADVPLLAALVAGVFSFSSPCCLPLVPVFLARVAGATMDGSEPRARGAVLAHASAYIAGFSLIFVALGIALGAGGLLVSSSTLIGEYRGWLVRVGGALLVLVGLRQLGLVRIPFLDRSRHLTPGPSAGVPASFVMGLAFGAGWSPCVGPILGIILTMAASSGDVGRAGLLLSVYSLGFGIPFLVIALTLGSSPGILARLRRHMGVIITLSGAILIGVGVIMLLGIYERLFVEIVRAAPWRPWEPKV